MRFEYGVLHQSMALHKRCAEVTNIKWKAWDSDLPRGIRTGGATSRPVVAAGTSSCAGAKGGQSQLRFATIGHDGAPAVQIAFHWSQLLFFLFFTVATTILTATFFMPVALYYVSSIIGNDTSPHGNVHLL